MKKSITIFIFFLISLPIIAIENNSSIKATNHYSKHKHSERSYQHAWCSAHNGIEEFQNEDYTRVDCLTEYNAVEFDFADKWAESIGQALYYQLMTGKKGMVVLILENPEKEIIYYNRVKKLSEKYNFETEYITPKLLNIKNEKCSYMDCKCNKK